MPIRPVNIHKKSPADEVERFRIGSVVEYEQHGKPQLAAISGEKRNKWVVLNERGAELELEAARLYLFPDSLPADLKPSERQRFLSDLATKTAEHQTSVQLEDAWEVASAETREFTVQEITELLFSQNTLLNHLATRRLLIADAIYFKRRKFGFEPRPQEVVIELKQKAEVDAQRARERDELLEALRKRLHGEEVQLPAGVRHLVDFAVFGSKADHAKETGELIDQFVESEKLELHGRREDRAFELLVRTRHFTPHENLDLIRFGRTPNFPADIVAETKQIASTFSTQLAARPELSDLCSFTIDAAETRDIDDALSLTRSGANYVIGIHISDVASVIPPGSRLEDEVVRRATSIYCPDLMIPMNPPLLSEDLLSLKAGEPRLAMSFFLTVTEQGEILGREIKLTTLRVTHRLDYRTVDAALYGDLSAIDNDPPLKETLHTLWRLASSLETRRSSLGAMHFQRRDMLPVLDAEQIVRLEESDEDTPARKLVGEMMIAANETAALFAKENRFPIVFRSQEAPDVDPSTTGHDIPPGPAREYCQRGVLRRSLVGYDPMPHYGLGLSAYTQVTSPIRRAMDLAVQRQIAVFLETGKPFYEREKLFEIISRIDGNLDEAWALQRDRVRYWVLVYIAQQQMTELAGIIVKVDGPKPLVELEVLSFLSPFTPAGWRAGGDSESKKQRGRRIKLRIDNVTPRSGVLSLSEIRE